MNGNKATLSVKVVIRPVATPSWDRLFHWLLSQPKDTPKKTG